MIGTSAGLKSPTGENSSSRKFGWSSPTWMRSGPWAAVVPGDMLNCLGIHVGRRDAAWHSVKVECETHGKVIQFSKGRF